MSFRPWNSLVRSVLAAAVSLTLVGCGFIFSHGPPETHPQMASFSCTEGTTGPTLDLVWAGLNLLGAAAAAGNPGGYDNPSQIISVGLTWGIVSTAAGVVGLGKAKRCQQAKAALAERQGPNPASMNGPQGVQSVVVNPASDSLAVGGRRQFTATAHLTSGAVVPNRAFVWSSSNDAIASVSVTGLVTAHAAGAVVIAANTGNVVGTARVVVTLSHLGSIGVSTPTRDSIASAASRQRSSR